MIDIQTVVVVVVVATTNHIIKSAAVVGTMKGQGSQIPGERTEIGAGTTRREVAGMKEEERDTMMVGVHVTVIIAGTMIMIEIERDIKDTDHGLHHLIDPEIHLDLAQKARGQVVLTWDHLLLQLCLVQLILYTTRNQCSNNLEYVTFRRQQLLSRLAIVPSICSKEIILNIGSQSYVNLGQLPDTPLSMPGMSQSMFPFGTPQLGAFPMMPAHTMTQQATRHARRVYVGGLPPLANEQTIATFFSQVMTAIGGTSAGPGDAVVNVYINHEKKFAFVEMRTVEEASNAMTLDGIIFEGVSVRVRRPTDYNPSLAAVLGPSQPNPNLNLAAAGLTPGGMGGVEGPDRVFVGGLPYYFTEVQIRELLESFGPLRGFDLVKDRDTGNSKGYGFCVYEDQAVTDVACAALNGLKMGDKTLTVRRATISNGQMKSEQDTILAHAQQHIAMQKMALQIGGFNIPGAGIGPTAPNEVPTKILCLTEVVTTDDLMDDGEYEDILEDMREEGQKFGDLLNVVIPRPNSNGDEVQGLGKVFLEYADTNACAKAKDSLGGRKFGGNVVTAVYYPEDKYVENDYGA
uniref:splicing factor U2af large subunit A-like isoform X2 n=1 Tax=Erigeron canadensis TaxID=72917 RepID=UPI001CB89A8F|nr:splicing factor U2af large subunit A-like isoform X2 [Erigeron canadensis]